MIGTAPALREGIGGPATVGQKGAPPPVSLRDSSVVAASATRRKSSDVNDGPCGGTAEMARVVVRATQLSLGLLVSNTP